MDTSIQTGKSMAFGIRMGLGIVLQSALADVHIARDFFFGRHMSRPMTGSLQSGILFACLGNVLGCTETKRFFRQMHNGTTQGESN